MLRFILHRPWFFLSYFPSLMNTLAKIFLAFLIYLLAATSASAGEQTGKVVSLYVRDSDGLIFVLLAGTATGRPNCANPYYWIIRDENSAVGKRFLSMLLTAAGTGQAVYIVGTNTCTRWPDSENIDVVQLITGTPLN